MFVDTDSAGGSGKIMQNVDSRIDRAPSKSLWNPNGSVHERDANDSVVDIGHRNGAGGLHQSASDFNLPSAAQAETRGRRDGEDEGIKRAYSELALSRDPFSEPRTSTDEKHGERRQSRRLQKSGKVSVSQYTMPQSATAEELAQLPKALIKNSKTVSDDKQKSPKSFSSLARRSSWIIGGSRSPSPSNRKLRESSRMPDKAATFSANPSSSDPFQDASSGFPKPVLQRRGTSSSSKSRRPLSGIFSMSRSDRGEPDVPSIPKSLSTDRLPLREHHSNVPEMPSLPAKDRFQPSGTETPRKKDELWSAFRSLDGDFQKFSTKPGTLKANVVRNTLIPFLKTYADDQSWRRLRPEDLDRRANILNKWWTGLLEMLNGRNGHSVSASDRPAVLDGVSAIMSRPEWRIPLSSISSRPLRSKSSSSLESNVTDFLAESVIQNVRNTFIQNLLSQMAFVAERMSQRSAPASIVTFCGKAAAYAFVYCPGVAEILVRLWKLNSEAVRRVLDEYGYARNANLSSAAYEVVKCFPSHMHSLAFSSVAKTARLLRSSSTSSLSSAYIAWDGPWKSRWAGKDSDLFFCFVKHHSILMCDILPDDATDAQRISAPGAILVQAQLLVVVDETIHRPNQNPALPDPSDGPLPITFDDVLGPDASALAVPASAQNPNRSMAENRLVMLLRDFLGPSPTVPDKARSCFADLFQCLLKATAKRISLFDHSACFTLCDLLEEAITILSRYYKNTDDPGAFLDWSFWFQVLRKMGDSNNTMTDMRLYTFVYSMWGYISKDPERKRAVCLDWLLEEEFAVRQFCHWCPMVRAYYMRLLCWRIVRCDGASTEADLSIYKLAFERLRTIWAYFLFLQRQASERKSSYLSTAPAHPAPQRRFLIMRNDNGPNPATGFMTLDDMAASTMSHSSNYHASVDSLRQLTASPDVDDLAPTKKRWSTIRGLVPFTSSSTSSSARAKREHKNEQKKQTDTAANAHRPTTLLSMPSNASITPPEYSPSLEVHHSFKFSLEWMDRSLQPRERKLFPPVLPVQAQQAVYTRHPELAPQPKPPVEAPQPMPVPSMPGATASASASVPSTATGSPDSSPSQSPAQTAASTVASTGPSGSNISLPPPPPIIKRQFGSYSPSRQPQAVQSQAMRSLEPPQRLLASCKYSGSALAEWAILVTEFHGFCDRRRAEGVQDLARVETPTLGVEVFRRPVG